MLFSGFSGLTLIKMGKAVTLPVEKSSPVNLHFGQSHDLLVAQENNPLRYYSLSRGINKPTLVWEKPMPKGLDWDCRKFTTPSDKLIMSGSDTLVFDDNLNLISKSSLPGMIRGIKGEEFYVACDKFTQTSGKLQLSRREFSAPKKETFTFTTPANEDIVYMAYDKLYAVCGEDGSTAVVATGKCFADFYGPKGQCSL